MQKILIIDDEQDLCSLMKNILEEQIQFQVVMAHDGLAGEQMAVQEKPDLIFLDFVMPKEKGDKVIAFLKKTPETKKIPIVLMSGLGEMVYLAKKEQWKWLPNSATVQNRGDLPSAIKWKLAPEEVAKEFGIAAYLHKPFTQATLLDLAKHLLAENRPTFDEKDEASQV